MNHHKSEGKNAKNMHKKIGYCYHLCRSLAYNSLLGHFLGSEVVLAVLGLLGAVFGYIGHADFLYCPGTVETELS